MRINKICMMLFPGLLILLLRKSQSIYWELEKLMIFLMQLKGVLIRLIVLRRVVWQERDIFLFILRKEVYKIGSDTILRKQVIGLVQSLYRKIVIVMSVKILPVAI